MGGLYRAIIGVLKEDTRSLDQSSYADQTRLDPAGVLRPCTTQNQLNKACFLKVHLGIQAIVLHGP